MKRTSLNRYYKWCETAKSSDKFIWEGVPYSRKEMDKIIKGDSAPEVKPAPKPEPIVEETINIDIETEDEDMGESLDGGDPEEY